MDARIKNLEALKRRDPTWQHLAVDISHVTVHDTQMRDVVRVRADVMS